MPRTIAALDLDRTDYRYYAPTLREAAVADADPDTKKWLELAFGIDYTARVLIRLALSTAAHNAASDSEPWVNLAAEAGAADDSPERVVVQFVLDTENNLEEDANKEDSALIDKLTRLESFAKLALYLAQDLRGQLGSNDTDK